MRRAIPFLLCLAAACTKPSEPSTRAPPRPPAEVEQVAPSRPEPPSIPAQEDEAEPPASSDLSPAPAAGGDPHASRDEAVATPPAPTDAARHLDRLAPPHEKTPRIERWAGVARRGELTFTDFLNFLSMRMGPETSEQRKRAREQVEFMLAGGMSVNARDEHSGLTPLMAACHGGDPEIIGLLLDRGAKVNEQRDTGETPLSIAVAGNHVEAARLLAERGAELNAPVQYHRGRNPLMMAAAKGDAPMVDLLLHAGADASFVDRHGRTALFHALRSGCGECSVSLLDKPGALGGSDKSGATALHYAAGFRPSDEPVCRSCGMYIGMPDEQRKAAIRADEEKDDLARINPLKALLKRGLDVNTTTVKGETALRVSVSKGLLRCTKALLAAGADVGIKDADGWSPLLIAASRGDARTIEVLLAAGASREDKNPRGRTASDLARESGDAEAIRLLGRR